MALFPERINGKIAAILTVHTDQPPAKICLALFDRIEDLWSGSYWAAWYAEWESHAVDIEENLERDQIEVGSQPIKTKYGWLIFYSYIYNYSRRRPSLASRRFFWMRQTRRNRRRGKAAIPYSGRRVRALRQSAPYCFSVGGAMMKKEVYLYYGGADTVSCVATIPLDELLEQLRFHHGAESCVRFEGNPILVPLPEHSVGIAGRVQPRRDRRRERKVHICTARWARTTPR